MTRPEYVNCILCGTPIKVGKRGKLPTRCRGKEQVRRPTPTETTCAHCGVTCTPSRNRAFDHCDECVTTGKARRDTWLRKHYGSTLRELETLFETQGRSCAICRSPLRWGRATSKGRDLACIDHDHETDKIRGVLCHHCNRALGTFGDNVKGLERALAYVKGVDMLTYRDKPVEDI